MTAGAVEDIAMRSITGAIEKVATAGVRHV
jgi:hypothetical protein